MTDEIKIKRKNIVMFLAFIITLPLMIIAGIYFFQPGISVQEQPSNDLGGLSLEAKFEALSNAKTNFCAGADIVERSGAERLQGSCCSKMDFHRYEEQVEGLKKFSHISEIPSDPYDISAEWAEKYIDYFEKTTPTPKQQEIYDEAMEMAHEGGPCCCKCWRWYAYGGLAEYLIVEHNFNSEQVAEVWDLSDGCGGTGHAHGGDEGSGGHGY